MNFKGTERKKKDEEENNSLTQGEWRREKELSTTQ